MVFLFFESICKIVKLKSILFLFYFGSMLGFSQGNGILERTKLSLKLGNSQKLSQLMGEKIQLGFEGEAKMVSQKEAESKLSVFFKNNAPSELNQLFQGQSKDGKQYLICKLKTAGGDFRISIYWQEGTNSQIVSMDFSKE